jgi:hypothetical protein
MLTVIEIALHFDTIGWYHGLKQKSADAIAGRIIMFMNKLKNNKPLKER